MITVKGRILYSLNEPNIEKVKERKHFGGGEVQMACGSVGISASWTGDCTAATAMQAMLHSHDRSAKLLRGLPQLLDKNEMGIEMASIKAYQ